MVSTESSQGVNEVDSTGIQMQAGSVTLEIMGTGKGELESLLTPSNGYMQLCFPLLCLLLAHHASTCKTATSFPAAPRLGHRPCASLSLPSAQEGPLAAAQKRGSRGMRLTPTPWCQCVWAEGLRVSLCWLTHGQSLPGRGEPAGEQLGSHSI